MAKQTKPADTKLECAFCGKAMSPDRKGWIKVVRRAGPPNHEGIEIWYCSKLHVQQDRERQAKARAKKKLRDLEKRRQQWGLR